MHGMNKDGIGCAEQETAEFIIHTTKKRPADVFELEKAHLRPISPSLDVTGVPKTNLANSITRTVRKDHTILYKSNRYTVPCGTYTSFGKTVQIVIQEAEQELLIYDLETGEYLRKHPITHKGKLIQNRNHLRDRAKGIDVYLERIAHEFENPDAAKEYLERIRKNYPRYIRDQLQLIQKQLAKVQELLRTLRLTETASHLPVLVKQAVTNEMTYLLFLAMGIAG